MPLGALCLVRISSLQILTFNKPALSLNLRRFLFLQLCAPRGVQRRRNYLVLIAHIITVFNSVQRTLVDHHLIINLEGQNSPVLQIRKQKLLDV